MGLLQGSEAMKTIGRPPGFGYSKYVDFLDIHDSWCPVSRLALELGVSDLTARQAVKRLKALDRVDTRRADRGPEVKSTGRMNI